MTTLTLTAYERSHRQRVLDLLFHSNLVFTHLDWYDASQWLDLPQVIIRLAWENNRIVGVLAVSPSVNGASWLRVASVANHTAPADLLPVLWNSIVEELHQQSIYMVALLVTDQWLLDYLPALGFAFQENIVTLSRSTSHPPPRTAPVMTIRPSIVDDLAQMMAVDQAAFSAPWQMSLAELRQARRIADSCTVALLENTVVGYQISTFYQQNGHLARLAVAPHVQGKGVGSALLEDLIERFLNRRIETITVNTQASNQRSQRLYRRYDFEPNGYDLPVWVAILGC